MNYIPAAKNRTLFPVILTHFLDNFGLALVYPIFTPLFLRIDLSFLPTSFTPFERSFLLGLTLATFSIAQFFGAPLIGQFSDPYGRKKAFFLTIMGVTIGYYMTGFSLYIHSLGILIFSRIWTGFFAGNLILCLATVADLSPDEKTRTKNFGLLAAFGGLSFIIAIIIGGIFSNPAQHNIFHPSLPFFIAGTLSFINLFMMLWLFKESRPTSPYQHLHFFKGINNIFQALSDHTLRITYIIYFFFMISWTGSMQLFPDILIQLYKLSPIQVSAIFVLIGALWSLSNLIINRLLVKCFHTVKIFRFCLISLSVLLLIEGFPDQLPIFLTLMLVNVCFASLCWSNGLAIISLSAPAEVQGSVLGINQSMTAVASILGPLAGGFLAGIDPHLIYFFTGLCALTSFSLLWMNCGKIPPPHKEKIS